MKSLLLKILVGGFILVLALVLSVLFINRKDEPPSQTTLDLHRITENATSVDDRENAYVYVAGFSAADDSDARRVGLDRVEWHRTFSATSKPGRIAEWPGAKRDSSEMRDAELKQFSKLCKENNRACADAMDREPARVANWIQRDAKLIARYEDLLNFTHWRNLWPSDVTSPMLPYGHVMEAQRLTLLKAWQMAGMGDDAGCKGLLERDLRFWRMTLSESASLIEKMIAVAAIEQHFMIGNLALRRLSPANASKAIPAGWSEPITNRERSMAKTMANEWAFFEKNAADGARNEVLGQKKGASVFDAFTSEQFAGRLFQKQATSNAYAVRLMGIVKLFDHDYAALPGAAETLLTSKELGQKDITEIGVYNPIGHILVNLNNLSDFTKYGFRVANLEGVRRASVLAAQFRSNGVEADEVKELLGKADLRDPYDGNAFGWNSKENAIVFRRTLSGKPDLNIAY
ncbi:hypothetical protein [Pseudoduganella violaceinigra]|uniref:hypothetical protein n=1 Tax=Pseudoduganella violaceinigra TaxID=246602 RepID=UPI000403B66F|nr:hypothetical protein [Pseudoduganella violaceinigra]